MSSGSLRLRLFLTAAASIAFALFITGLAIVQLFERQVRDRVLSDIENNLLQLAGAIDVTADGSVKVGHAFADPRFDEPYGGRYWRIDFAAPGEKAPREPLQSRSVWDTDIDPLKPAGPEGEALIFATRQISVENNNQSIALWLTLAVHAEEVLRPIGQLRDQMILSLTLIGILLSFGAWIQVTVGLRPLEALRRQLADVRSGLADRLSGSFPSEVAPLIGELNDVLDMRGKSLERARRRAGDLAHGLKTPLTIFSAIARDLRKHKLGAQADEIDEQAEAMRRHVEQALIRAKLSTGRGHVVTPLRPLAEKVIAALQRLPKGDELDWDIHAASNAAVPLEPGDLTELLGNLLDNARKWAKSRVSLSYASNVLTIEDDGPGVPEDDLSRIGERGQRLDETKQGSGLGLSIVEDIADIYGLTIDYDRSELGGLRVTVRV
jgi:signal transduction histidine kinase